MAVVTLDDGTGRLEVVIYAELLQSYADLVVKDRLLVISGKCNADEFSGGYNLTAETVYDMDGAREHFAQSVLLSMTEKQCRELTNELISLLKAQSKGTCPIVIEYSNSVATARFDLGRDWTVRLTDALIDEFRRLFGESAVSIHYATVDTSQLQKG